MRRDKAAGGTKMVFVSASAQSRACGDGKRVAIESESMSRSRLGARVGRAVWRVVEWCRAAEGRGGRARSVSRKGPR